MDEWTTEVLAFTYGPTPIFHREQQPAMVARQRLSPETARGSPMHELGSNRSMMNVNARSISSRWAKR